jgi:hypothetical protein
MKLKRLKYWFQVRWSASHYASVRSVEDDFDALYKDLKEISDDRSFTKNARDKAYQLFTMISDKSFVLTLKFFKDILYVYKNLSEDLQARTGLLLGSYNFITAARKDILDMKAVKPPGLTTYLASVSCPTICELSTFNLEQYEECEEVVYKSMELVDRKPDLLKLSSFYDIFIDGLVTQIDRYFPPESLMSCYQ